MQKQFNLEVGSSINIKRSDGRVHLALVADIDAQLSCVKVEWFEEDETKGKEIDLDTVLALNPGIIIHKQERPIKRRSSVDALGIKTRKKQSIPVPVAMSSAARGRSARSRLTQSKLPVTSGISQEGLSIKGKRVQSSKSSVDTVSHSNVVKEVNKLEKNRIERRLRQAETKAYREELVRLHQDNPHWKLQEMINDYRNKIDMKPLSQCDLVEDHLITVCVRKRPLNERELAKKEVDIITVPRKNQLIIHEPKNKVDLTKYLDNHIFNFDYAFNEFCSNEMVYKYTAQPLIKTIFEGGFATCFAYGQTGSGKTFTMSGSVMGDSAENGIYFMVARDIFKMLTLPKYRQMNLIVSASYFEIYTRKVLDLLNNKACLKILEDGKQQVQVVGLTEKVVGSVMEVLRLIQEGNEARTSGQTSANMQSSRSHAVFQIYLRTAKNMAKVHGKFSLIDLAGNERGADTLSSDKQTRMEGAEINKSLLALKECIRALGRKGAHLPFRVSKLTQVLRDSFVGANSRTCMIAMISPNMGSCEHTLNTLRYADRVKELGGSEVHVNTVLEESVAESPAKLPLQCIEESMEFSDISASKLSIVQAPSPRNNMEVHLAEKKMVENHTKTTEILAKAWEQSKHLLDMIDEDVYEPMAYCKSWEAVVDNCLSSLLTAKELIVGYQEKMSTNKEN